MTKYAFNIKDIDEKIEYAISISDKESNEYSTLLELKDYIRKTEKTGFNKDIVKLPAKLWNMANECRDY